MTHSPNVWAFMAVNYRSYQTNHKFIFCFITNDGKTKAQISVFILWSWSHLIFCTDAWQCSTNDECQWFQWTKRASYWFTSWILIEKLWIVAHCSEIFNYNSGLKIFLQHQYQSKSTNNVTSHMVTYISFSFFCARHFISFLLYFPFEVQSLEIYIKPIAFPCSMLHAYYYTRTLVWSTGACRMCYVLCRNTIVSTNYNSMLRFLHQIDRLCCARCSAIQLVMLIHLLHDSWMPKSAYNCNQIENKVNTCIQTHTFYCQKPKCGFME